MARAKQSRETKRLQLQAELDRGKTQAERNRLGQFATPTALALDILNYAETLFQPGARIRFLDPAIGTGSFYSALLHTVPAKRIVEAVGFEVDPYYGVPATEMWSGSRLKIQLSDFTRVEPSSRFNLIVCNPPYVRHHHLQNGDKARLQRRTQHASGMKLSGLAGLYCHFLGLSHAWMAEGGIGLWLIPSEFMDVNYGRAVKQFLLDSVTLLQIHRFDPNDIQFSDALVSSAVVAFRKAKPPTDHNVVFTFGGTLGSPNVSRSISARILAHQPKWTRFPVADIRPTETGATLADFFQIKRGIATGDNSYFILSEKDLIARGLPMDSFTPILPGPRYLESDEVSADRHGQPKTERRLFLLDTKLPEDAIREQSPALYTYLQEGRSRGVHRRYLCEHRALWYGQETRPPAPVVCTYLGRGNTKRGRPFRFILNHSRATVANVYLAMYPTPRLARAMDRDAGLIRRVWQRLNEITPAQLLGEGRVYGGGLHKLEPKELANVPAVTIAELLPEDERPAHQRNLFDPPAA